MQHAMAHHHHHLPAMMDLVRINKAAAAGTSSRILYDIPCKVCQDHSSGKHYGIFACDGCAGFFKRSIRRNRQYVCKAKCEGSCVVDKTHRNQCRACRLRKCLLAGMNKDAVQHERGPRNSTLRRQMCLYFKDTSNSGPSGSPPPGAPMMPTLIPSSSAPPSALNLALPKGPSGAASASSSSDREESPPTARRIPPQYIQCQPQQQHATTNNKAEIPMSVPLGAEAVCEAAARLLFMNVQWARSLPAFIAMPLADQLHLLEQSWRELFVLGAAQFSLPLESLEALASSLQPAAGSSSPHSTSSPRSSPLADTSLLAELRALQDAQIKFRLLAVDQNEFSCLRALVLFKTGVVGGGGLHESTPISALQDHTQLTLSRYIACAYPTQPFRFGKLLLLLPTLRSISCATVETLFFKRTIGDIPIERIICDMYKSSDL